MEENRLKQMPENYDQDMFNRLYKKVEPLKRKLAGQINSSRLGVDYEEILSSFDVKFIFVFSKYYGKFNEDVLLGHLIRAMQLFKCRVLRTLYSKKNEIFQKTIDIDELTDYGNTFIDHSPFSEESSIFLDEVMNFLKSNLTSDAYEFLKFELTPPEYILSKLPEKSKKIPNELIIGYFDIAENGDNYINSLRSQVQLGLREAKKHFSYA